MGLETMAIASMALAGMGAVSGAVGQYQQGKQQSAQAKYQAQVAANNATIAEQNARDAVTAGKAEEQRQRIANSQKMGQMRAQFGASGVDLGTGSALDATADQAMVGEYDALGLRDSWQRQKNAYDQQASDFHSQAAQYTQAAKNATSGGMMGAATSLLSGAGQVAGSWYKLNQPAPAPKTPKKTDPNAYRPWG